MKTARTIILLLVLGALAVLAGCSSTSGSRKGGYYKDDGPGDNPPADIEAIPDAVPRIEKHAASTLRPYVVFGKRYVPLSDEQPFRQTGTASWYGRKFHGAKTSNGETYDMYAMTAAHTILPIPSYARVTRVGTGRSIIVRINDRGPFHDSRIIDLSYVAAAKLGIIGPGSGQVIVEAITNKDIALAQAEGRSFSQPVLASSTPRRQPSNPTATEPSSPASADALSVLPASDPSPTALPPPPPPQEAPAMPGSGSIYLQYGAFSGESAAQSLAQRLNQQIGLAANGPAKVRSADDNLYRVQIGPYASRVEAVNAALHYQQLTGSQATIALR